MQSAEPEPRRETGDSELPVERPDVSSEAMLYCPACNERLMARQCKLICERCGYYMSCADYY
ncbi:MAG: hypothetical protein WB992_25285 [Bryobacteraceae bacterium]